MPTFYNYALNDMEESQINDAKRRVTGYNNNQTERLSSKPEEDPTNGLIDIQLSRLTDEIYLAGKEIDNLDSYLQIDTSLIVMNAGIPSAIKKTIQDSVRIYISINQSVEKIKRTYKTLSKNIKFASLHIWTDFTAAVNILFKQNLVLNDIVDKFVNDYRAAIGQPPVNIRRPDRIDEDPGDGGDGGDDDDDDGGDDDDGLDGYEPFVPPPSPPVRPPPLDDDTDPTEEESDPTDPDSEPSSGARSQIDAEELQDTLGVDAALPPPMPLPQPPSRAESSRFPLPPDALFQTRFPLRVDTIPPRSPVSESGSPRPFMSGLEGEEEVDFADVWPDLIDSRPKEMVWPTIANIGEEVLTLEEIEDMPFWPDIEDQEGFKQRFLANKQDRLLGKMVTRVSSAYANAWKTLAGSRSPRSFAQILGKTKNKMKRGIVRI